MVTSPASRSADYYEAIGGLPEPRDGHMLCCLTDPSQRTKDIFPKRQVEATASSTDTAKENAGDRPGQDRQTAGTQVREYAKTSPRPRASSYRKIEKLSQYREASSRPRRLSRAHAPQSARGSTLGRYLAQPGGNRIANLHAWSNPAAKDIAHQTKGLQASNTPCMSLGVNQEASKRILTPRPCPPRSVANLTPSVDLTSRGGRSAWRR